MSERPYLYFTTWIIGQAITLSPAISAHPLSDHTPTLTHPLSDHTPTLTHPGLRHIPDRRFCAANTRIQEPEPARNVGGVPGQEDGKSFFLQSGEIFQSFAPVTYLTSSVLSSVLSSVWSFVLFFSYVFFFFIVLSVFSCFRLLLSVFVCFLLS